MKELFDRHQDQLTDAEDRTTWQAMHDATRSKPPLWQRWGVPGVAGIAVLGAFAFVLFQSGRALGPAEQLAEVPHVLQEKDAGLAIEATRNRNDAVTGPEAAESQEREAPLPLPYLGGETAPSGNEPRQQMASEPSPVEAGQEMASAPVPESSFPVDEIRRDTDRFELSDQVAKEKQDVADDRVRASGLAEKKGEETTWSGVERLSTQAAKPAPAATPAEGRVATEFRPVAPPPVQPGDNSHPISVGGTDPVNGQAFDAMFFEHYGVNPFVDPLDDRFATFAVDVDNASYTLTRSYLMRGALPPKDAVRVEEFVNAFNHNSAPPRAWETADRSRTAQEETFAIHLDAAPSPFGEGLTLMRVGIKGREVDPRDCKPAVLTFVIDVSGSMNREDRLELVKRSLTLLVDQMRESDEIGIVVYGSDARVLLEPTAVESRQRILDAIYRLQPEGSTNAEAGLRTAYALAGRYYRSGAINRLILCSDGVANVGRTGAEDIHDVIRREAGRGLELTTIGFGMGNYNDVLMEKLANQGDGSYYYVDDLQEARRVFVENLTGTLQTIARQVKIQVEFNPDSVRRYRLLGYENRDVADRDFRNDAVDAGEIGAGHEVTALFEVKLEPKAQGEFATVRVRHESPETGRVREESRGVAVRDIARDIRNLDPSFALDAAVAEFAEILRHSYWAKESNLRDVARLAGESSNAMGRPEATEELVRLIDAADRLWNAGDSAYPVRPRWEPDDR